MPAFDLSTPKGRRQATLDYMWNDHAWLRLGFDNAHWVSPELVRTNQPWPFQLARWKSRGIRTVVNLRGGLGASFHALEVDACERLGLTLINFTVTSRDVPVRADILEARELFASLAYPALIHCKSGADRVGIMSVLYRHFRLGEPIALAKRELALRYLHMSAGKTGVLDYVFDRYLQEAAPRGRSFVEWVESPAYDPVQIKADFRASWWGNLLTENLLRRE